MDHVVSAPELQTATAPAEFAQPVKHRGFWHNFVVNNRVGTGAFVVFLASLIPFGTFILDPTLRKEEVVADGR